MRFKGFFTSVTERTYMKKDGTEGRIVETMFAIQGERDVIRVSTWHDMQWCLEKGIVKGAAGELRAFIGTNDRGYYEQTIWGFEPFNSEQPNVVPTDEMKAAAERRQEEAKLQIAAGTATTDLPFK